MKKRVAFTFDEDALNSLENMLDEQLDDYVRIVVKHPVHGDEQEILLPNIDNSDSRIIKQQAHYEMRMHSDIINIEYKILDCKKLVDEMIRTDDYGLIHQLEANMRDVLSDFRKFGDPDYGETEMGEA